MFPVYIVSALVNDDAVLHSLLRITTLPGRALRRGVTRLSYLVHMAKHRYVIGTMKIKRE